MKPEERDAVIEECAKVCDRLAEMMDSGAGEPEPGGRLRQCARTIRALTAQSPAGVPPEPNADAERFRWLCEDHDSRDDRLRRDEVLRRMPVMSYSAACSAIDNAMTGRSPVPDRAAGVPTTEPVAPIARALPRAFAQIERQHWKPVSADKFGGGPHDPWFVLLPNSYTLRISGHIDDEYDREIAEFIAEAINLLLAQATEAA
jgi:hypothetical protein